MSQEGSGKAVPRLIAKQFLGRARREVYERIGRNRLINTPGLILSCVRNGAIIVAEADSVKARLESQGQTFTTAFESFSDLL